MDVNKLMLRSIFDTTERLDAPLFQRPYVWNKNRNWVPLWEAIDGPTRDGSSVYGSLVGSESTPTLLHRKPVVPVNRHPEPASELPFR